MRKLLISLAALLLLAGCDWPGGSPSARDRVESLAERELGDDGADVEVELRDRAGGCEFYTASTPEVLDSFGSEYAVLKDGGLVSSYNANNDKAADVLRSCGAEADAVWWAEAAESFAGDATGVVVDGKDEGSALRRIIDAGMTFQPPRMQTGADGVRTIDYFTMNYQLSKVHEVTVSVPRTGPILIEARQLDA